MICKIKDTHGESLAEILISTVIIAMAMVMLASMVMASKNLIDKSSERYTEDMKEANEVEAESVDKGAAAIKVGTSADGESLHMKDTDGVGEFDYDFTNRKIPVSAEKYGSSDKAYTYK
jgi:Tfp pilus assembly protein PilV